MRNIAFSISIFLVCSFGFATKFFSPAASTAILPDTQLWNGKSLSLITSDDDPWITPAEKTGFTQTPSYDETVAWLKKLVDSATHLEMLSLGKSPQHRDIWMVIASKEKNVTPEDLKKSRKPIILAQAGIHAGEIDGKDAGMMLLRDMTVNKTKAHLLDKVNFLFVPIFNVDGHERSSEFSRVNQRGPKNMGWRTNATNLNLNRDYTKLDAPELTLMLKAINQWKPDLYLDLHVTDGVDYQYDITFTYSKSVGPSPSIGAWLEESYTPYLMKVLSHWGHTPTLYEAGVWKDRNDLSKGIISTSFGPRYSTGFGGSRHLPTVLLEAHSLKPYKQRVLGAYVFIEATMNILAKDYRIVKDAIFRDDALRRDPVPLDFKANTTQTTEQIEFKAIEYKVKDSNISGGKYRTFLNKKQTKRVPFFTDIRVTSSIKRPKAYIIPAAYSDIIERLRLHSIEMTTFDEPKDIPVTMYRLSNEEFAKLPFEGRFRVTANAQSETRVERFERGSVRIDMNQSLGDFAAVLLEPVSEDSFFQWGFFNSVFQATEYIEPYVMEPMAQRMLAEDAKLAKAFKEKLKDKKFRDSPRERYRWFYLQTPYADQRWKLYPVAREE